MLRPLPLQWHFSPRPTQAFNCTIVRRSQAAGFSFLSLQLFTPEKGSPSVPSSATQTAVPPPNKKKKKKKKSKKPASTSPDSPPPQSEAEASSTPGTNENPGTESKNNKKKKRKKALALARRFDGYFGAGALSDWQRLCQDIGLEGDFSTKGECRKALGTVHVNIQDLLDAVKEGKQVERFKDEKALAEYCKTTGKLYPKDKAKESGPLVDLLRILFGNKR